MMRRPRWILLALLACAPALAGPPDPPRVAPDPPSGSPREAELARRATAIVDAFSESRPVLSRDGKRVFFVSNRDGLPQLYAGEVAKPEAPPARVVRTTERITGPQPLPDGKSLIFLGDRARNAPLQLRNATESQRK
jgi:hypothetical protein